MPLISPRTFCGANDSSSSRRAMAHKPSAAGRRTCPTSWSSTMRLTPTEFRILYLLVTNAGHVVPASRLYTYVWGSEGADANALRSHMSHLRRKIEAAGDVPGTITAVPAVGYVFRRVEAPA